MVVIFKRPDDISDFKLNIESSFSISFKIV